jgi:hypothetical protein
VKAKGGRGTGASPLHFQTFDTRLEVQVRGSIRSSPSPVCLFDRLLGFVEILLGVVQRKPAVVAALGRGGG